MEADVLYNKLAQFVITSAGKRILRGALSPDLTECQEWVARAKQTGMSQVQARLTQDKAA
jgi:hypothetical protein